MQQKCIFMYKMFLYKFAFYLFNKMKEYFI